MFLVELLMASGLHVKRDEKKLSLKRLRGIWEKFWLWRENKQNLQETYSTYGNAKLLSSKFLLELKKKYNAEVIGAHPLSDKPVLKILTKEKLQKFLCTRF